jgi:hypothetical protein
MAKTARLTTRKLPLHTVYTGSEARCLAKAKALGIEPGLRTESPGGRVLYDSRGPHFLFAALDAEGKPTGRFRLAVRNGTSFTFSPAEAPCDS